MLSENENTLTGEQQQTTTDLEIGFDCTPQPAPTPTPTPTPTETVTLTMPNDWTATSIDNQYYANRAGQCSGDNHSPALSWAHTGSSTVSTWTLTLVDVLTNDGSTFTHYTVTGIDAATLSKALDTDPATGTVGANWDGDNEYTGPCPPTGSGEHTYTWTITALDAGGATIGSATFASVVTV
jgi:phosphatidylethanolamine-binding protein (PEBP) family uncharacterized protein